AAPSIRTTACSPPTPPGSTRARLLRQRENRRGGRESRPPLCFWFTKKSPRRYFIPAIDSRFIHAATPQAWRLLQEDDSLSYANYWQRRTTRRRALAGTGALGAGVAAFALVGCGDDDDDDGNGDPAASATGEGSPTGE